MITKLTGCTAIVAMFAACAAARADELTAKVSLDQLVPYTQLPAAWSDQHSNVAFAWTRSADTGMQDMVSIVGWGGPQITGQFLRWNLTEDDKPLELKLKSRNFRPDKIVEVDTADGIELTVTAAWPARDALVLEMSLANLTGKARGIKMSFDYPGKGTKPDWKGPFPPNHFVSIDNEPEGCWSTLYAHLEHGRNVLWVQNFVAGMSDQTTLEFESLADLSARNLSLDANGKANLTIPMGFGLYRGRAQDALDEAKAKLANGWTAEQRTKEITELLRNAPPLPERYRNEEKYQRMYAHAITTLNSLCVRGEGGYLGNKCAPYTTKSGLAMPFFWDTSFTSTGLREFDPKLAQEAVQSFTDNATPRGSLPGTLCDSHRAGEGQAPIMGWAAWSVYQRGHDKQWLARVYPALAGNHRFWLKYHASSRGLCQFFNAGQIGDDDARFDPIQGKDGSNQNLSGIESPDLNSFLVMDGHALAHMADELGLPDEARAWREQADALGKLIIDTMYFPQDAMFFDVKTGTHEKLSGVKSPNMFLPLWAGVPLEKEQAKAIVERHMLNPAEFYRELPFPSLSYDNPNYTPDGYWRGRIWPHITYWMVQTLWRQGSHHEAEEAASRILAMMEKSPWLHENYESGKGGGIGQPDYNWGCATAIELLLERYKDEMP